MSGSKAPNYDTYGLFRATHSHVYAPLRSVLNMCHWHIAPYPIFAYRGIIIIVLTCKLCITINYIPYSIFIAYLSCIIPVKYSIAYIEPAIFIILQVLCNSSQALRYLHRTSHIHYLLILYSSSQLLHCLHRTSHIHYLLSPV